MAYRLSSSKRTVVEAAVLAMRANVKMTLAGNACRSEARR
jgi:hypothetical protein